MATAVTKHTLLKNFKLLKLLKNYSFYEKWKYSDSNSPIEYQICLFNIIFSKLLQNENITINKKILSYLKWIFCDIGLFNIHISLCIPKSYYMHHLLIQIYLYIIRNERGVAIWKHRILLYKYQSRKNHRI